MSVGVMKNKKLKLRDLDASHTLGCVCSCPGHGISLNLRKMFDSYDENHDGTVSRQEVEHALTRLELSVTYATRIFTRVDTNGDVSLDFKEFVFYVQETEQDFHKLFDLIDTDGERHPI